MSSHRQERTDRQIRAVRLNDYGGPEALHCETVGEPVPGAGEILVRVAGAAVNPVDIKSRRGDFRDFMPLTFPAQLGGDVSGVVEAVGPAVNEFVPGDRVMGMIDASAGGAYAEKIAAPAAAFVKVPEELDLVDAAALPMAVQTGTQLVELGIRPKPGDRVLVTGAAGSVARAAIHAALDAGAKVIAGARAHSLAALQALPVEAVVDLADPAAVEAAGPYDAIADTVGGETAARAARLVRPGGVVASVVVPPPEVPEGQGVTVVPVWVAFNPAQMTHYAAQMVAGRYTMPVAAHIPLADAPRAHALMEKGGVGGKIILVPDGQE